MTTTSKTKTRRLRYHHNAYQFVFASLRRSQDQLERTRRGRPDEDGAHISGPELLDGIRQLAVEQFGLMIKAVFRHWGVEATADFGRIVFELIERGEMRRTDRDQVEDFFDIYDFDEVFDRGYRIGTSDAFE